ncbi:hypothetical protein BDY19DRAFT_907325 [Irpex rosettiformis]|uniref:Uncharacterized protein n=1 Tax=Irpex rosettiformis TaxID=378272 RepID=A0ACB8U0N6_9APHY|nr:hypothetical protein BDY19DRAFT_907325 [Irpex rosettiformis]
MAPKASTSTIVPSALLADAVNAFTKAASLAVGPFVTFTILSFSQDGHQLAAVEEESKLEVAKAHAELANMRREHSKNMKFMNQTQLQEKDWERHGEMLKTSLEKAELTIKHQAETIVQLRGEVMQWKSQLTRLEETSRRETQDWKEQYMRAEQERSRLSSRIDELVAEQLQNATQQSTRASTWIPEPVEPSRKPSTARKPHPSIPVVPSDSEEPVAPPRKIKSKPSSTQNVTDRERTYVEPPSTKETTRDAPAVRPKKRQSAVAPRAPPTPRASVSRTDFHNISPPSPQLIRRVHAIVEVPVKEEVYSDEENALASDDPEWQPKKVASRQRRRSSIKSKPYVEIDEQDDDDEDDDDQLLIGAEDNPSEIYGTRRVVPGDIRPPQKSVVKSTVASKKRKLDIDFNATGRSVTKVVRKK